MDQILEYIAKKGQASAGELLDNLDIPERTLFRILEELVDQGRLIKVGNRPYVVYKLPSVAEPPPIPTSTQLPEPASPETSQTTDPVDVPETPKSPFLVYWCTFLRLDIEAVRGSYEQIRPLIPNYQSIGMNPPKTKRGGLKVPDPIWVKFFNLLTWIIAILWTALKNLWTLFRKIYKGEIPWGPIVIGCLAAWLIFGLIVPWLVKLQAKSPEEKTMEEQVAENRAWLNPKTRPKLAEEKYYKVSSELSDVKSELDRSKNDVLALQARLEKEEKARTGIEEPLQAKIRELEQKLQSSQYAFKDEERKRLELEQGLQSSEQELNARIEGWQKTKRDYDKKLEASSAEIRELEQDLSKANQETRQLNRQLQREQAEKKELEGEIEELKKIK